MIYSAAIKDKVFFVIYSAAIKDTFVFVIYSAAIKDKVFFVSSGIRSCEFHRIFTVAFL